MRQYSIGGMRVVITEQEMNYLKRFLGTDNADVVKKEIRHRALDEARMWIESCTAEVAEHPGEFGYEKAEAND